MSTSENKSDKSPASFALLQMLSGFWLSAAIYAAAKLGLADELGDGPKTVDYLAQKAGVNPDALYRLLRALGSAGIFTEAGPRRFALTPLGEYLRSDVPGSLRSYAIVAKEMGWEPWGHLLHSVKTGETAFHHVHGTGYFDFLREHPDLGNLFNEAMTGFVTANGMAVAAAYDFAPASKIVDIGGGNGTLITAILKKYQKTSGIIFDLPGVIEEAKKKLGSAGLSDRCACIGGNFFKAIPSGADVYVMASIIHDWDDEHAITILRNCGKAMPAGAKLLLVEMVIPPGDTPFFGKLLDLMMLVNLGGRERTEDEYRDLLAAGGFHVTKIIPTKTPSSIIEAVAVQNRE
jgi:hypothetical protein